MTETVRPDPILVAAAASAWVWVPDDAVRVEGPDYLLVHFPDYVTHPLQLLRVDAGRPSAEVLDEVLAQCVGHEQARVCCWVRTEQPPGLEDALVARGGVLDETLDVLARSIARSDLPDLDAPADVQVSWVEDVDDFRDASRVGAEVFGGRPPTEAELHRDVAREVDPLRAGWGATAVARIGDRPVGTAGVSLVGGVARLWGGSVLDDARGRGVYRALLGARLRFAVERGAILALVKGRVQTSGPILRRAGFDVFGQERSYLLEVPSA